MANWVVKTKGGDFGATAAKFGISPVVARLIRNRDVDTQEETALYLNGKLEDLSAPELLKDGEKAAALLLDAISQGKKIRVLGDYDIDGVCATYILVKALKRCGASVDAAIPERVKDGYGINRNLITRAKEEGVGMIVTCDNGIAAYEEIAYARELSLDVIVTDHHEVPYDVDGDTGGGDDEAEGNSAADGDGVEDGDSAVHGNGGAKEGGERRYRIPPAAAVVDPKRPDCPYPFKGLCGAAVAYRLAQLLYGMKWRQECGSGEPAGRVPGERFDGRRISGQGEAAEQILGACRADLSEMLELAAFATVGDVMELKGENRILVRYGLEAMRNTKNPGLRALMQVCGVEPESLSAYHVGFVLGPCINATGRLDTAKRALSLLQAGDGEEVRTLAEELKSCNEERKGMTEHFLEEALRVIEKEGMEEDKILVIYLPDCHESIAGIIAGRIREVYLRPVFVLTRAAEGVKGSGRSIEAYDMFGEMSRVSRLFTKFGGHRMAAGLSMEEASVGEFRQAINENCSLTEEDFVEKVLIDMQLPFSYADGKLIQELKILEPFGMGNRKPLFAQRNIRLLSAKILGKNQNVLKLRMADESRTVRDGVCFGDASRFREEVLSKYGAEETQRLFAGQENGVRIMAAYYPSYNEYMGKKTVQLVIQHYRV